MIRKVRQRVSVVQPYTTEELWTSEKTEPNKKSHKKLRKLISKLEKLIDNCDYHYVGNVQGSKIIYAYDVIEVIDKFKKSIDN